MDRLCAGTLCLLVFLSAPRPAAAQEVRDLGLRTGMQDTFYGHHKRGRAMVSADFNLDGRPDFFLGSPGDESLMLVSIGPLNSPKFVVSQILLEELKAWGAAAADYDNDGDYDLFVSIGGNEGPGYDFLFQNMIRETGEFRFRNVSEQAGILGPVPEGQTEPAPVRSGNAVWGDYDQDGDVDLFLSVNDLALPNVLWRNNGDGTFSDATEEAGLSQTRGLTRHSTFFDIDNDGDLDLYENNYRGFNVLWRNNGDGTFSDVTAAFSPPGEDVSYPFSSFASCAADFDNDGFEDLFVFTHLNEPMNSPYQNGHALFLNQGGTGFVNVAASAEVNNPFISERGVMGCQIGDLNGDGTPDFFVGNGNPDGGQFNQLFLSDTPPGQSPHYVNQSDLIDFPAPETPGIVYPPYPYRTHGTSFVDIDGDGTLEMAVSNGGPAFQGESVREPNRLFKFNWEQPISFVRIRPVGDGVGVSRDAVGARIAVTVNTGGLNTRTIRRSLYAGSCFSGQHGFDVHFLLGDATAIESVTITWPNGVEETITQGLAINTSIVVEQVGTVRPASRVEAAVLPTLAAPADAPADAATDAPGGYALEASYPNPFNPTTEIAYTVPVGSRVSVRVFNVLGQEVATLVDGYRAAGRHQVTFDATALSAGVYLYVMEADGFTMTRRMTLLK